MQRDSHTAVVTGASGYLAQAVISEFLDHGLHVVAASRKAIRLNAGSGWDEIAAGCDLATPEGAGRLSDAVSALEPRPLIVVNCVGYFPGYKPFLNVSHDETERTIRSNFTAVYFTALSLMPLLRERGGHFITFTTISAPDAYPLMAAFDSSKAAVEQLTRHLANEFGHAGVQANTFALATLKTPEEIRLQPHGDHDHWVEPREVAANIRALTAGEFGLLNGTTFKCYHYSGSFYQTSYLERVSE